MVTAVIVGAGHRALTYASYSKAQPDKLKIVGVADPIALRREQVAAQYGLSPAQCFESASALAAKGKIADAVINGTMDRDHVSTTLPLLDAGYDVLLEKPFAVTEAEVHTLDTAVKRTGRKVMICHVLRYAPFYTALKQRVLAGEIGDIINIQTAEHVSYHHVVIGYVRGKWHRKDLCGSSMLMAKCCHDLDLISWFKSGIAPKRVASFGGLHYFKRDHAPVNSGEHCLLDCPIENDCLYSARKHYLDHPQRWSFYVWAGLEHIQNPTLADKEASLKEKSNPYGRCVWKLDNNVVDRQSVLIEFADGSTATHNMVGGCSKGERKIHIVGTRGELHGSIDEEKYRIRRIDPRPGHECDEVEHSLRHEGDTTGAFGGHGGGDLRLVADFVAALEGRQPSISCTVLADSVNGHLIGFCADRAMEQNTIVEF
ncbi:MAG: oxidoreductase [Lentisphaerae bacterium RIFOXYB12_FULL_65_16]|nr:MAG: oxidoreductase [Lentisphaerae bacterium RIFOXYA12_64_32]OGV84666.1 MAG: oxidoreductase [Lentisphaerae bacterium RIFOXYB12_FULL_65_16]